MDLFALDVEKLETEHNKLWEVINANHLRHKEKTTFTIAKYVCSGNSRYGLWRNSYPVPQCIGYYDSAKAAKRAFIEEVIQ